MKHKFLALVPEGHPDYTGYLRFGVDDDNKLVELDGKSWPNYQTLSYLKRLKRQARSFEKWFLSQCSPGQLLECLNVYPVVEGGRVVDLLVNEEVDNGVYEERELTELEWEQVGLDRDNLGTVEAHPEGADRGGYVPTLTNGCTYDESCCEWGG